MRADTDLPHAALRADIIAACLRLERMGVNQGTSGNVSARVPEGFLITPSGLAYDLMKPEDIVLMTLDGGYFGDLMPSSEWQMHSAIYHARPDAGAVVHTHSVHATAVSCLRRDIPAFHYLVALAGGKSIRCSDYAPFGTKELAETMLEALHGHKACLLANHGLVCLEATLPRAIHLCAEVETLARQYLLASAAGTPVLLGDDEIESVVKRIESYANPGNTKLPSAFLAPRRLDH
jgi:L-fuculose-phosphate aldolase